MVGCRYRTDNDECAATLIYSGENLPVQTVDCFLHDYKFVGLSSAIAAEGYYIVGLETVDQSPEAVFVFFLELLNGEVGCDVGFEVELRPYFIAGMEEFIGQHLCIHAVEGGGLDADVIEADVYRLTPEALILLLVEGVAVEVVVEGIVVYHLRYREVVEEVGIVRVPEVFRENLHQESFTGSDIALEHDVLVELVTAIRKDFLGQGAVVEVEEQKAKHIPVVIVNHELAALICKDLVGNPEKELCMGLVNLREFQELTFLFGLTHVIEDAP